MAEKHGTTIMARPVLLLGPPNSTNFLHLKFPLICNKIARGEHVFCLDSSRLAEYFDVRGLNVAELSTALCNKIIPVRERLAPNRSVDPVEKGRQYRRLLENGVVKNQSELAAYIGVSRAWMS